MFYLTTHSEHFNTVIWRESKPLHGLLFPVSINGSFMEGRKEMFHLTTHSTHFILYAPCHRQDSRMVETINSSMGPR